VREQESGGQTVEAAADDENRCFRTAIARHHHHQIL
jgi:hypothetical protein